MGTRSGWPADAPDIARELGGALRRWREQVRISQVELAARIGTHQWTLSDIEGGKRLPNLAELRAIEEGLGLRLGTIGREVGLIEDTEQVRSRLADDPQLEPDDRVLLVKVYDDRVEHHRRRRPSK
jgi:transcriptional regulator with XRE-family HTH domain